MFKSKSSSIILAFVITSCTSATQESDNPSYDTASVAPQETSYTKIKFEPFTNINQTRQSLSKVGIGNLDVWKSDEMGGYMSITPYYQFGGGNMQNNLAFYLESDNPVVIKRLQLVLNINNGNKTSALSKFSNAIRKTYRVLDITPSKEIINASKAGNETKVEHESYIERIELEQSQIQTWKFIIDTK